MTSWKRPLEVGKRRRRGQHAVQAGQETVHPPGIGARVHVQAGDTEPGFAREPLQGGSRAEQEAIEIRLICGDAGFGKSTTAAALALRGIPVCSEDIVPLAESHGQFEIIPGYPRVCLWPDSVEMLLGSQSALPLLTSTWEKRYLPLDGGRAKFVDRDTVGDDHGALPMLGKVGRAFDIVGRGRDECVAVSEKSALNWFEHFRQPSLPM